MINPLDTKPYFPFPGSTAGKARGLVRDVQKDGMSLVPEKTEEEKQLESNSSPISFRKELTPEEKKRVTFLKDMMAQILTLTDGQPTEEQKARIREIEKELEKITGVKMRSRVSDVTAEMPEKDDEDKKKEQERQIRAMGPSMAEHRSMVGFGVQEGSGIMKNYQQNAVSAYLKTMDRSPMDGNISKNV
ncbi:hypothetical protein [uncultured Pseudodesulfovibrio sp.]|uniref:hypothetical protein n=1 Tax=uncultured Pseudodesulfovibrio sp. TaxID=2035858 RepID=UPI0029C7DCC5|nr:hypothetical protein [uncultured Pseudodesulfovibrio sp.]